MNSFSFQSIADEFKAFEIEFEYIAAYTKQWKDVDFPFSKIG